MEIGYLGVSLLGGVLEWYWEEWWTGRVSLRYWHGLLPC